MTALIHCIYASAATRAFETAELSALLLGAREHNLGAGLTGMLLYTDGSFFQVLEGEPQVVDSLYLRIGRDQRHRQVTKIVYEEIEKRSFGEWTMGFTAVSRQELAGISGINDFFSSSRCFVDMDSGRAKNLLTAFREGQWRKKISGPEKSAA